MAEPAQDFLPTEHFDLDEMASFMRRADIYKPASDALAPDPQSVQFAEFLQSQYVSVIAATFAGQIIGYVYFNVRTSIGAEIHCGFHPQARGRVAKVFIEYAIGRAFSDKGLLKLWAMIPSDNRPALQLAGACGFSREGVLTRAIARTPSIAGRRYPTRFEFTPDLRDIIILGRSKEL